MVSRYLTNQELSDWFEYHNMLLDYNTRNSQFLEVYSDPHMLGYIEIVAMYLIYRVQVGCHIFVL